MTFEDYCQLKFGAKKRFSIEGLDSGITALSSLVDAAVEDNVENLVFGMAHRGRVSILANVFKKPLELVFAEFKDIKGKEEGWAQAGDVKYHLSQTVVKEYENGKKIRLVI
jgi:2-oxoglutarate dehydrogenase E1 component